MDGIKVIRVVLPETLKYIEVIPIGDAHLGDEWCDESLLKDVVKYVLEKPYRYVILNGDLINNAIKTSISDTYGMNSPEYEIARIVAILSEIKDRILAMGSGNHEERTLKLTGIDPSRYIAHRLGLEDRYADNSFVLMLSVGQSHASRAGNIKQQVYSFFVQHGFGGGKKSGSKLNNLDDASRVVANADVYIFGHTHDVINNAKQTYVCDFQNRQIYTHKKYLMMHNAFLTFGGYGLRQGFSPLSTEITYARLFTQGRKRIALAIGMDQST